MRTGCLVPALALLLSGVAVAKDPAPSPSTPRSTATTSAPNAATSPGAGSGDGPLVVTSDNGIEWLQDQKLIIARVNAKAVRGNNTVTGDTLIAHYRPKAIPANAPKPEVKKPASNTTSDPTGGDSEVWRVEADGHVTVSTPTQTAYGDHADYNIDDAVAVLTGQDLRLITPTDVITARDTLEYWDLRHQAIARGNAVAIRQDKRIQADVLVADFAPNEQNQMTIQMAHGFGHVILTTPTQVVTGDRADYNLVSGIVTVRGVVKMTQGQNQLDGGYAVINMNTNISHIYPAAPGEASPATSAQVKGLLVPQKNGGKGSDAPAAAPNSGAK